jgi:hypothetical protein
MDKRIAFMGDKKVNMDDNYNAKDVNPDPKGSSSNNNNNNGGGGGDSGSNSNNGGGGGGNGGSSGSSNPFGFIFG